MAQLPERITTLDDFTSKVKNSTSDVFVFIASQFSGDFTPEAYRFADICSDQTIYAVTRADFEPPVDFDTLISKTLKVPRQTKLVLWRGRTQQVIAYAGKEHSNLMAFLDTVGLLEKKNTSGDS
ncbi:hypothetical protein BJX62DRAFT_240459 [Aspergillus germanicus]